MSRMFKEIALIVWWIAIAASWFNVALKAVEELLTSGCQF